MPGRNPELPQRSPEEPPRSPEEEPQTVTPRQIIVELEREYEIGESSNGKVVSDGVLHAFGDAADRQYPLLMKTELRSAILGVIRHISLMRDGYVPLNT
ncbi:MAG: hypothetical protein ABIP74_04260 [Candidatus Saccharimonas sp.]